MSRTCNLSDKQCCQPKYSIWLQVDLTGQNLLVATNKSDPQNLHHRSVVLKVALAWGMEHLEYVGQCCMWPRAGKEKITGRIGNYLTAKNILWIWR